MFRLRPLHDALREAIGPAAVHALAAIADSLSPASPRQKEAVASAAPTAAPAAPHPDLNLRELSDHCQQYVIGAER